ncbi:MAG: methyl-accepting chemotaxis protein [bacterium]
MQHKKSIRKCLRIWIIYLIAILGIIDFFALGTIWNERKKTEKKLFMSIVSNHARESKEHLSNLVTSQGPLIMSLDDTFAQYVGVAPDAHQKYMIARKDMKKSLEGLSDSIRDPRDAAVMKDLANVFKRYTARSDRVLKYSDDADESETAYDEASKLSDDIMEMEKLIKKIIDNNAVQEAELKRAVHEADVRFGAAIVVLVFVAFSLTIWVSNAISNSIARPLNEVVKFALALAEGDLTRTLAFKPNRIVRKESEIGRLCENLEKMAGGLREMLNEINSSTSRVNEGSVLISQFSHTIMKGTDEQSHSVSDASVSIKELTSAIDVIAEHSKGMGGSVSETADSIESMVDAVSKIDESVTDLTSQVSNSMAVITQMAANTAQVHKSAKVMGEAVQETSSTIQEMLASVEEVATNAVEMDKSVEEAFSTVNEMLASIEELSANNAAMNSSITDAFGDVDALIASVNEVASDAKEITHASEEASKTAESGGRLIKETIEGMKGIKVTVSDTARKIRELGESSAQIGNIVSTIREIADQTNLLALNAAIEAARAGEEGRGFNVVAQNIKKLAERSTEATKDIEKLVRSIQKETEKVVSAMDEGVKEVQKGTDLADQASEALTGIVTSVNRTASLTQHTYETTTRQISASDRVKRMMSTVSDTAGGVTTVARQQQESTIRVKDAFEKLRMMAHQVRTSTDEQKAAGKQIAGAVETLNGISLQLTTAIEEQEKGSNQMVITMENINTRAHEIQESISRQRGEGERIRTQTEKMQTLTRQVTEATLLQSQSSHRIVEKMTSIGSIAENNARNSNDVRSRAEKLVEAVALLEKMISRFTVTDDRGGEARGLALVEEEAIP